MSQPSDGREGSLSPPPHIAIIMDGNGRWARQRGLPRLVGHREGRKTVRRVTEDCNDLGVRYLTLYTFSTENWQRPVEEVRGLMRLVERALRQELAELHRKNVRVVASGRLAELPNGVQQALQGAFVQTGANTGLCLNIAINYSGRCELVDAVRKLAAEVAAGTLAPEEISEDRIAGALYQPAIPDPDLLIRTGGDMRYSNFLLWEMAYTELYVTDVLWPDFTAEHLEAAIEDLHRRQRRFGRVPTAAQSWPARRVGAPEGKPTAEGSEDDAARA